jgi:5'(3')-deoxyribonucleotidase
MSDRFDDGLDRLRVGIDMDGVVADFNSSWIDRYNGDFGASLEVSQVTTWDGLHRLTHFETMGHFWDWARGDGHSIFRDAPPMPGAIESLGRIGRAHRLVIVSSKFDWAIPDSLTWLATHGVAPREVHFLWDKTKAPCDVFLDDAPHQVESLVAARPDAVICRMVQPWNEPVAGAIDIHDWDAFEALLGRVAAERRAVIAG